MYYTINNNLIIYLSNTILLYKCYIYYYIYIFYLLLIVKQNILCFKIVQNPPQNCFCSFTFGSHCILNIKYGESYINCRS